jgi:DNA-binding NarL/FixJ family response regulator
MGDAEARAACPGAVIRVFLADDHAIVRHGLRQLIAAQPDMQLVGEASDGRQVLTAAGRSSWDVLVLDLSLPRVNGTEVLRRLRVELPRLRILVLSMYPESQYAARLLREGAAAYLSKTHAPEEVLAAVRAVARGGTYVSATIAEELRAADDGGEPPHASLSAREYQVFTLIFQGSRVSDIAAELDLSASTVSNHVARIKEKLGARSIAEIVNYAHRAGLVGAV